MTSAVTSLPPMLHGDDASALARKRRREIILSQRSALPALPTSSDAELLSPEVPTSDTVVPDFATSSQDDDDSQDDSDDEPLCKKSRLSSSSKKPQMKYDPDVPMTKEEAAVWRREQRRKRNRESAAASRQRQRDRIAELEVEVEDWKEKYDEIMNKISALAAHDLIDSLPTLVSPVVTTTSPLFITSSADKDQDDMNVVSDSESEKEHDHKMISRPAQSRIFNPNLD